MALLFKYSRRGGGDLTPIIPVSIGYKNLKKNFMGLIDTGADETFIPEDVAGLLGIKYQRGEEIIITGIDKQLRCTKHFVTVTLFDGSETVTVKNVPVHVPKLSQKRVGILLGRRGLLDKFELRLNEKEDIIALEYLG